MSGKALFAIAIVSAALAACADETRISAIGEKSREEIVAFFTNNEFGRRPKEAERPALLRFERTVADRLMPGGAAVRREARVVYGGPYGTNSFPVVAYIPAAAKGPVPAFLLICNRKVGNGYDPENGAKNEFFPVDEIVRRGFAAVSFTTWDVAPDYNTGNTKGVFEAFEKPGPYRNPKLWGTISAWAWGASRTLDWLETLPEIDAAKVAVSSFAGKNVPMKIPFAVSPFAIALYTAARSPKWISTAAAVIKSYFPCVFVRKAIISSA
jgi:hypothetical protein